MKKNRIIIFTFLVLILSKYSYAKNFRIVTENFPPYNYTKDGVVEGFSTSIVKAVLKEIKLNPDNGFEVYPWVRAFGMAKNTQRVLIFSMGRNEKREKMFKWIGPIAPSKYYLFSLSSRNNIKIEKLNDAKKFKIGTVREDVREQYLISKGFKKGKNIFPNSDYFPNFLKLKAKRIDLWAMNEMTAFYLLKNKGFNPNKEIKRVYFFKEMSKKGLYMAFNIKTPDSLYNKFKNGFQKVVKSGEYDRLKSDFFK